MSFPLLVLLLFLRLFRNNVVHSQVIPKRINVIVTMGDSFASGMGARGCNGAPNYAAFERCYRSPTSWGAQFAQRLGATYMTLSCAGSGVAELNQPYFLRSDPKTDTGACPVTAFPEEEYYVEREGQNCDRFVKAQSLKLNTTNADLVVVGTGANDFQYENILSYCLFPPRQNASGCQRQMDFVRDYASNWTQEFTAALLSIGKLIKPEARILVMTYPHIVLNIPYSLSDGGDSVEITSNLRSLGLVVEESQRLAVDAANAAANRSFVTLYDQSKALFEGHEPNPSSRVENPDGWLWEKLLQLDSIYEYYHPNPTGHYELGLALYKYILPFLEPPVPSTTPPCKVKKCGILCRIYHFFFN